MEITTKVISPKEVVDFVQKNKLDKNPVVLILFVGDRLTCCDEAVAAVVDDKVVGVATISPAGEDYSGTPTIVGLYVLKSYRRKGIASQLLQAAVERMEARMLKRPFRVDTLSSKAEALINSLDEEIRKKLQVNNLGSFLDMLPD